MTQQKIKEMFSYDKGKLYWRVRRRGIAKGDEAGGSRRDGRVSIGIDNKHYLRSRIVWLYHYGYMPEDLIDHEDRDRTNDKVENLREVSYVCNTRNTGSFRHNTSGIKGVSWCNQYNKWKATVKVNQVQKYLGRHTDFLEAVLHRLAAEQALDWEGCDSCSPAFKYYKENLEIE